MNEMGLSDRTLVALMAAVIFSTGYQDNTAADAVRYAQHILSLVEGVNPEAEGE